MLQLRQVDLRRGTRLLLEGTDLTVYPGQKVGLVGANGCGKSSLFAMIRGELHPDAGDIHLPPGWEIAHVDVDHRARETGRTKYTNIGRALVGALDLFGVWWLMRRRKRPRPRSRGRAGCASRRSVDCCSTTWSRSSGACISGWWPR